MCFNGFTAKNSFENRHDMLHMMLISMPLLLPLSHFPKKFQCTMIGFNSRKMYKFIYKQISPKSDYFGYFSMRTWLYFCIVFICGIATSAYYDVKELIRPSLFSLGHDFKNPIFAVFKAKYLWKFLSISGKTYIIRIVSSRRIFEKKWRWCHMHFKA